MADIIKNTIRIEDHLISYFQNKNFNINQETLIWLHGWGSNKESFIKQLNYFCDHNFNCLALDLPGFGQSSILKYSFNLDDYIDVVNKILKKLEFYNYSIISHSFGARIAIKGSAIKLFRPNKIVFTGAAGISDKKITVFRKFISKIVIILKKNTFSKFLLKKLIFYFSSTDYKKLSSIMKDTFKNIISEDLLLYLSKITVPCLIIWGEHDNDIPVKDAKIMNATLQNSSLKILSNAGHYAFIDNEEQFNKLVIDFLINNNY